MTITELRERMSVEEFTDWRAYDRISPVGDQRVARQLALLASMYANAHRGARQQPFDIDDWDLCRDPEPPMTRAEQETRFRAAFAGKVKTRAKKAG